MITGKRGGNTKALNDHKCSKKPSFPENDGKSSEREGKNLSRERKPKYAK